MAVSFIRRCVRFCTCGPAGSSPARWNATLPVGVIGVSSHGRVQNKAGITGWGYKAASGYLVTKIGGRANMVHRLVARAFLGPPPSHEHWQVHHRDRDPTNNHMSNLEYVTPAQNVAHSYQTNTARRTSAEALSRPVLASVVGDDNWSRYSSINEASRRLLVPTGRICSCCKGRTISSGGYKFRYESSEILVPLPTEEWRTVCHPANGRVLSLWAVSSLGRVMSPRHITWGTKTCHGYRSVSISESGISSNHYVHRLVARAFLGPAPSLKCSQVNHRDSDRCNNRVENLEYVTPSENTRHSYRANSDRRSHAIARAKPVWGRKVGSAAWTWYPSMSEAARQLSVFSASVSHCCRGRVKGAGHFEFVNAAPVSPKLLPGEEWREMILDQLQGYVPC